MKTLIIMPAYNEAKTIGDLVTAIKGFGLEVLVVDDGSMDDTVTLAEKAGAVLIKHDENLGKGLCLKDGFEYAKTRGFDAVIAMDADGQHSPDDIPKFIEKAHSSQVGMVIGNRMENTRNMPLLRVLTNKFMSWLLSKKCGQKVPDTQCGFRLIKREVLESVTIDTSHFEIESELILKAARQGFRLESIPIKSVYGREHSKINPFIDTLRFARMFLGLSLRGAKRRSNLKSIII